MVIEESDDGKYFYGTTAIELFFELVDLPFLSRDFPLPEVLRNLFIKLSLFHYLIYITTLESLEIMISLIKLNNT
jgi:hypothetical protein